MNTSFKVLLFGLILTALIGTLLLTVVTEQGNLYEKDLSQVSSGSLSLSTFNNSLSNLEATSQSTLESFQKQNIFVSITNLVISGLFNVFVNMLLMIITPFTLVAGVMTNVFHVPVIVTSTLLGLLILSVIFALWQLIKSGNS